MIKHHRLISTSGQAALEALWSNTELDNITVARGDVREAAVEAIQNIVSGLANKRRHTKQVAELFLSKDEVLPFRPQVTMIGAGYMALKHGQKPVGRLILDAKRRKLNRIVKAVGRHAMDVFTDRVYVAPVTCDLEAASTSRGH